MRSFVLLEKTTNKTRNRIVIVVFTVFIIIASSMIYKSALYGFNKLTSDDYSGNRTSDAIGVSGLKISKVNCADNDFRTYIAKRSREKESGLSVFNRLEKNEAMIFVFESLGRHSIWMKNMKFPIDIIWLDQNGLIVDIAENVAVNTYPNSFTPKEDAMYVLEFNANTVKNLKIKIGDTCDLDYSKLK